MSNDPTTKNPAVPNNTVHMEAIGILTARPACMHLLPLQAITGGKATFRIDTEEAVIEQLLPANVIAGLKDEARKAVVKHGDGTGVYYLKDSLAADLRLCLATCSPGDPPRYICIVFQCPYSSLNEEAEQRVFEKWSIITFNFLTALGVDPIEIFKDMPA